jgi:hypothetical protein
MKTVALGEIFTAAELARAKGIGPNVKRLLKEIVEPAMRRIDEVTGQENDPRYWAHALASALDVSSAVDADSNDAVIFDTKTVLAEIEEALESAVFKRANGGPPGAATYECPDAKGWRFVVIGLDDHVDGMASHMLATFQGTRAPLMCRLTPALAVKAFQQAKAQTEGN